MAGPSPAMTITETILFALARGRVLAGDLRRNVRVGAWRFLRRAFVHLQTRHSLPFPPVFVFDIKGELADALDVELDLIAIHKRVEPAVIGAGGDDVARLQGVDRGQPFDAARDLVRHVAGVEVLHQACRC